LFGLAITCVPPGDTGVEPIVALLVALLIDALRLGRVSAWLFCTRCASRLRFRFQLAREGICWRGGTARYVLPTLGGFCVGLGRRC